MQTRTADLQRVKEVLQIQYPYIFDSLGVVFQPRGVHLESKLPSVVKTHVSIVTSRRRHFKSRSLYTSEDGCH